MYFCLIIFDKFFKPSSKISISTRFFAPFWGEYKCDAPFLPKSLFSTSHASSNFIFLRSSLVGSIAGVNIFETSNMADSSGNNPGTTGDYKGAVFNQDALGLAMMQDLKIETQRDASLRADEIVATAVYGVGELNDANGVEIESDSTIQ